MNRKNIFLLVTFVVHPVFAVNMCEDVTNYYAVYNPNQHTCSDGYYLPVGVDSCAVCPDGGTCTGGIFSFNQNDFQGLTLNTMSGITVNNICADNFPQNLSAIYEPNSHTCIAGQYLPAGVDECTQCPSGSACIGGTYSFNETTDQGIQSCAAGTFAPTGSAVCYPHIFHVGDDVVYLRSTKLTTPSLNVKIGNDMFYANMTTVRTKMNKDSAHYFHAQWENNDYYICDDTTCPQ